jgi:hypothetical protein
MPSAQDIREFRGFLRNATDRQVQGIYDKEKRAGRDEYADLAVAEADRRGIELDNGGRYHSTKKQDDSIQFVHNGITYRTNSDASIIEGRDGSKWNRTHSLGIREAALNAIGRQGGSGKAKSPAQLDREIAKVLAPAPAAARASVGGSRSLVDAISPGSKVTIVDRFGVQRTGRAVMRGPYGWVLNMGGKHGTPAIASADNTVSVRYGKSNA